MKNVIFHHLVKILETANYEMNFLPPYSQMLNPCEEVFSLIKLNFRRDTAHTERDTINSMKEASNSIYSAHFEILFACLVFNEQCLNLKVITRKKIIFCIVYICTTTTENVFQFN